MTMQRLLYLFAAALLALSVSAQDAGSPIVPLTERIFLTTERDVYALGDVLTVRGNVLSSDYSDFRPYSRYVNLELIGSVTDRKGRICEDSVIVRQKVRTDERGYFFATIPTEACKHDGRYYLRAYTRFMRNQPVETFPLTSVQLDYFDRKEQSNGGLCIVSFYPEGGTLLDGVRQQLVTYVTDTSGRPVDGAQLAVVAGADTLATAVTRPSGYASLMLMDGALHPAAVGSAKPFVSIVYGEQTMRAELPAIAAAAPQLRVFRTGQKLRVQVSLVPSSPTDLHLYGFQSGFGLQEFPVPAEGSAITLDTGDMPDGLFTFWLTAGDSAAPQVLSQRSVWVGIAPHQALPSSAEASDTAAVIIRHLVTSDHHTPRAFEMLHLYNVRSDAPFPAVIYSETEREARTDLDLWLATTRFVGFDIADALAARFDYPFLPEQTLTLAGTALTPDGRPLKAGSVELLNLDTMEGYVCPIEEGGHYAQEVADYADGARFFIESVDKEHKNHRYGVTLEEERPATMHNWLRLALEASAHSGQLTHTVTSTISGGVDLSEAVVTARSINRIDRHTSQMEGITIFGRETLQQPQFFDLESVLRRSGWIDIRLADTDNPAPQYVKSLREGNVSLANSNDWGGKMPINKVCIYRGDRVSKQSLMEGGVRWMNFLLDGVLYTHNFEDILSMSIDGLESVEIVRPSLSDPRLIRHNSMDGLIIIKSRHLMDLKDIPSAGITVQPAGLTLATAPDAPAQLHPAAGQRIAVDVITPDRRILSWEE